MGTAFLFCNLKRNKKPVFHYVRLAFTIVFYCRSATIKGEIEFTKGSD